MISSLSIRNLHLLLALSAAAVLVACAGTPAEVANEKPAEVYARAVRSLNNQNYANAAAQLEFLEARFPFGPYASQARLDLIYAYHRQGNTEPAIEAADQFIRENPRHPNVDYAYYMRGLIYFEDDRNFLQKLFRVNPNTRPSDQAEKSIDNFTSLVQRFPDSKYSTDARQRILFLRNRLAEFEYHVAEYYMRRGAYGGAINRVNHIMENYQDCEIVPDALEILVKGYRKLGMEDLAADAQRVLEENFSGADPNKPITAAAVEKKPDSPK